VPKPDTKIPTKVTLTLQRGPVTPAQKAAGRKFWQRVINSVREELQAESEGKAGER